MLRVEREGGLDEGHRLEAERMLWQVEVKPRSAGLEVSAEAGQEGLIGHG